MPISCSHIKPSHLQEENPTENEPGGFHLIPLPFADDIRGAPIEEATRGLQDPPPIFLKFKSHNSIQPACRGG